MNNNSHNNDIHDGIGYDDDYDDILVILEHKSLFEEKLMEKSEYI